MFSLTKQLHLYFEQAILLGRVFEKHFCAEIADSFEWRGKLTKCKDTAI